MANNHIQSIDVQVTARLTLSWEEAVILEYMTSYNLTKHFKEHFGSRFTPEFVAATLKKIRESAAQCVHVHEKLIDKLKEHSKELAEDHVPILQLRERID